MLKRSNWLHLRIPFSYFLLPVFLFSLSLSPSWSVWRLFWTFIIVHVFLYPASNGYNSYFDKDEGPIGGLKNPPPVSRGLYYLSLSFDAFAILLSLLFLGYLVAIMAFAYGLVSKAYSHPAIRLKQFPWMSWFIAGFFQGCFTFFMCYIGLNSATVAAIDHKTIFAGLLSTVLLWGSYPMTQIYQHEEDAKRGDRTLSLVLGVHGTFLFTAIIFTLACAGFVAFYTAYFMFSDSLLFLAFLIPVLVFFGLWYLRVRRNPHAVNHSNAMWLNFVSSTCLNVFFLVEWVFGNWGMTIM